MNNEEKIITLLEAQQTQLSKINARLDALEETAEITRDGVNALLEWAEACSNAIKFPLPRVGDR